MWTSQAATGCQMHIRKPSKLHTTRMRIPVPGPQDVEHPLQSCQSLVELRFRVGWEPLDASSLTGTQLRGPQTTRSPPDMSPHCNTFSRRSLVLCLWRYSHTFPTSISARTCATETSTSCPLQSHNLCHQTQPAPVWSTNGSVDSCKVPLDSYRSRHVLQNLAVMSSYASPKTSQSDKCFTCTSRRRSEIPDPHVTPRKHTISHN